MYESHFGLAQRPFSKTPDPRFLYESPGHAEALARLMCAIEEQEIGLLTGEVGTGKTTLCRTLIDRLDERYRVALVVNPRLSAAEYLGLIAARLGVDPLPKGKVQRLDALSARLFEIHQAGQRALVIVDEAQLIGHKSVFEELRLLTNIQLDDEGLVALVLIGQPELRAKLARKTHLNFSQRISMAYHLGPLEQSETEAYVAHRMRVAGATRRIFDSEALTLVHAGAEGVPRRINTICQGALLVAFGEESASVSADHVADVLQDLRTHLGAVFKSERREGAA